jgi:uncharacterized protein
MTLLNRAKESLDAVCRAKDTPRPSDARSPSQRSRFATARPDVLTYRTDPLDEDLTVAGPIAVRLQVASTGADADFVVKLIDENATSTTSLGNQQLVRGEPMPARFRNSFSSPEALRPNEVTGINYTMPDINHTFQHGHRVVVQVQSSWFPLNDLNPQSFVLVSDVRPSDFVKDCVAGFQSPQRVLRRMPHYDPSYLCSSVRFGCVAH